MIESTGVTGVVSGQVGLADSGATDLVMNYVPGYAEIAEGDVVVSSGLDRIFPKGLMVRYSSAILIGKTLCAYGLLLKFCKIFDAFCSKFNSIR